MIFAILPSIFFTPISSLLDGIYRGRQKFKELFFANIIAILSTLLLTTILIIKFRLFGALITLATTPLLFIFSMIYKSDLKLFNIKLEVIKDISSYSFYVFFANLSYFMYTQSDIFVLEHFGYIKEIGYYAIIDRFFYFFLLPSIIFGQVLAPKITEITEFKNYDEIRQKFRLSFFVGFPISVVLSAFLYICYIIFYYHFSEYYNLKSYFFIISILFILLPFKIFGSFTVNGFITPSSMVHVVVFTTIIGGILNIFFDIVLIKNYGFQGVFISTLIVHSFCIVVSNIVFYIFICSRIKTF